MKIVILDGIHNKNGMTMGLVNQFIDGFLSYKPNTEVLKFDLLNSNINFCRGCGSCAIEKTDKNSKCVIIDDVEKIKKEALSCDILVFATPIYEYCVSSAMKRFLERCLTLVTFKFGPAPKIKPQKGKYGIIICSSGAPFPFNYLMGIVRYPKFMLKLACKLFGCEKIEYLMAGGMTSSKLKAKWEKKANKLGQTVAVSKK